MHDGVLHSPGLENRWFSSLLEKCFYQHIFILFVFKQ
jgi:hypothetical protein